VVQQLREQGFTQAYILRGGFAEWLEHDGLVEPIAP
jgi:rhodanese-related sulfurtransferase